MMLSTIVIAFAGLAVSSPAVLQTRQSFDSFVTAERQRSLEGALANIGGTGSSLVPGADPGMVVASPATVNPNYFYSWTRDSALTMTMLIDELVLGNTTLRKIIEDYTSAQAVLQTVSNPSGTLWPAGLGLADPKFYTNKTRFNGDWGRPQRDGPALRAIAFMDLSAYLIGINKTSTVKEMYWPLILNDLKYVGEYWNNTGYDLWEEVHGNSFFTINSQHRALVQGAKLAKEIDVPCKPCGQAPEILCFLSNNFWNETGGYLTADVNVNNVNRSGINTDQILGSIHVFDIEGSCDSGDYQPCNSKMLATHKVVVDSFRNLYPINKNASTGAVAVGRYPEDTYYDGNPWYLCTLACAELLYDAVAQIKKAGKVTIDKYSLPFFKDLQPAAKLGSVSGKKLTTLTNSMLTYADGFVEVVQTYLPPNGSISEEFNATTGEPTSAWDLTWSFASFVTMAQRRSGQYPPSWGANTAAKAPAKCKGTSYSSFENYTPALAAGAKSIPKPCDTEVLFTVNASTAFGQNIYLVGNTSLLGGAVNNPADVILPCNPGNYTWYHHEWYIDIWLPAGMPVHYQYVNQQSNGSLIFENVTRVVHPSKCGGKLVMTDDVASFPGIGLG